MRPGADTPKKLDAGRRPGEGAALIFSIGGIGCRDQRRGQPASLCWRDRIGGAADGNLALNAPVPVLGAMHRYGEGVALQP